MNAKWVLFGKETVSLNSRRNLIQQMCFEHYEEIQYILKPRPVVMDNINRLIRCGDPDYGGALFICPECGEIKFVPYRCHSKLCSTCGAIYSLKRAQAMQSIMIDVKHRHIVFTIDEALRPFFLHDRSLLNLLFDSVEEVLTRCFQNIAHKTKCEILRPSFTMTLHTFGRPLEWNPHIHVLCTEGAFNQWGVWRPVEFFPYEFLRKSFQKVLLDKLRLSIGPSFQKQKVSCYKHHKDGFYVYAQPFIDDKGKEHLQGDMSRKDVVKYVSRYLGRPVIATSRIDSYDGQTVVWHYNKHEDETLVTVSQPVLEFLKLVFMHLPEKNFKMIRYGGFYASKCKARIHAKKFKARHGTKSLSFANWRDSILKSFGYDPLICAKCGETMIFAALYFQYKKIPLEEIYREAIIKLHAKEDSLSMTKTSLCRNMKPHLIRYSYQRHTTKR